MCDFARYWAVGDLWFERRPLSHILCFAAPARPCAMDSDEPMETDERQADKSFQADKPTGDVQPSVKSYVCQFCATVTFGKTETQRVTSALQMRQAS